LVIHRCAGIRPDIESLIPGQRQRHSALQRFRRDNLAVHLERAGARAAKAADAVERQRGVAKSVIFEVVFERMLAGRQRFRAFPAYPIYMANK